MRRALARLLIVLAGLSASRAHAQSWRRPSSPIPGFASARPVRPPNVVIEPHRARTTVALSGSLDGPVAIDGHGQATFLTEDGVLAKLAPDGNLRWSLLVGPPGGEPAIGTDGTLYTAGRDERLYAVDENGRLRWTGWLAGRPVHGVAVGAGVVAVALETARLEIWRLDGERLARIELGAVPAAAAVLAGAGRVIVPLTSGQVVAVAANRIVWRTTVAAGRVGPLAIDATGDVIAGAADGTVARLRPDGTVAWRTSAGSAVTHSPALAEDGTIYVAAGRTIVAIAPSGDVRWRRDLRGPILAGPLVADGGLVYAALADQIRVLAPDGSDEQRIDLPAAPTRGLALSGGMLWVGLRDLTLRRFAVPERGLAHSSWAKARGNQNNTGAL